MAEAQGYPNHHEYLCKSGYGEQDQHIRHPKHQISEFGRKMTINFDGRHNGRHKPIFTR